MALAAISAATLVLFSVFPTLDIWVSRQFLSEAGFALNTAPALVTIRATIRLSVLAVGLFSLAMLALSLRHPAPLGTPRRVWGAIVLLYLLGPALLVNGLLKELWGRARPADTTPFGGDATFTPPYVVTDQCATNCSFVSGEAAGATALAISLAWMARPLPSRLRLPVATLGVTVAVLAATLRVIKGRHFLSDVILAALFVGTLAAAIACLMRLDRRR
ncbi:phosphatase PAP2 family protein [Tranquillimonas rosea]|uniref:phosphatase PAP2 family protein n=1 Tax=Tranquillimonas rosea TaxID=641238 RepID=UPI003BA92B96